MTCIEQTGTALATGAIDRRGLMKGALAGAVLFGLPAPLWAGVIGPRLFIYDGRFAQAVAAAAEYRARGIAVLDSQAQDLGHAWRQVIPQHLAQGGSVAGMTLWVDSFVCETFGRDHKLAITRYNSGSSLSGAGRVDLQQWVLA